MAHRNRWFTVLENGWIFHGELLNNQRVLSGNLANGKSERKHVFSKGSFDRVFFFAPFWLQRSHHGIANESLWGIIPKLSEFCLLQFGDF